MMRVKRGGIKPDPEDFAAVERENGRLPEDATERQLAEQYRLALANKLIRLYAKP
jgi:hypothetical protein